MQLYFYPSASKRQLMIILVAIISWVKVRVGFWLYYGLYFVITLFLCHSCYVIRGGDNANLLVIILLTFPSPQRLSGPEDYLSLFLLLLQFFWAEGVEAVMILKITNGALGAADQIMNCLSIMSSSLFSFFFYHFFLVQIFPSFKWLADSIWQG